MHLATIAVSLAGAGCGPRACRAKTALVTFDLPPSLADADRFRVSIAYQGRTVSEERGRVDAPPVLEVDLGGAYREGQGLTLSVVVLRGGLAVGEGKISADLVPGCTALQLPVTPLTVGDLSVAGSPDAGGDDASRADGGSIDGGASLCPTFGEVACYGAEGVPAEASWSTYTEQGMAKPSTGRAYRGSQALRLDTNALSSGKGAKAQLEYLGLPGDGPLYARAFIWADEAAPAVTGLLQLLQPGDPYEGAQLGVGPNGLLWTYNSIAKEYREVKNFLPTGRWVCLELGIVRGSTVPDTLRVWLDGNELPALASAASLSGTLAISAFFGGPSFFPSTNSTVLPWSLWMDEVGLDTKPIGCAR